MMGVTYSTQKLIDFYIHLDQKGTVVYRGADTGMEEVRQHVKFLRTTDAKFDYSEVNWQHIEDAFKGHLKEDIVDDPTKDPFQRLKINHKINESNN